MDTTQQVSLDELLAVIYDATAQQDHRRVESSAKRLKQLFQQPGVYDALHTIAADKALPLSVRIQASIQFKNEALKNWKSRKLQNDQYRANIRARCMMFLDEEDATIADCNKVSVAKIARADFPQAWPSLLDYLMSVIDDTLKQRYGPAGVDDPQSNLKLQRALQLLCAITKEFSSMKMLNGIQVMKQIFDHLHHTINNYFVEVFECIQLPPSPQTLENPRLYTDLVVSHLLFKTLVTLLIWIWQRASRMTNEEKQMSSPWISAVFSTSIQQLQRLVVQRAEVIKAQEHTTPLSAQALSTHQVMTKHIRRFGKFFLRMAEVDPRRMAELPQCSDIVIFYWDQIVAAADNLQGIQGMIYLVHSFRQSYIVSVDNPAAPFPVRFLVQGLVLFKDVVGQWTAHRRDGTQNKIVLQEDFIKKAVTIIITRLLPFTQQDLQGLGDDPEEWVNNEDQENQQWEYELRPCSERVLMQISNQYPEYVTPLLKTTFDQVAYKPAADIGLVNKEALYCAIGRCCQRLKEEIPFEKWMQQVLITEVQSPQTDLLVYVLQRRIAWLLGKWMSESCCSPNIPTIWQILVHLLSQRGNGSTVIRLTAAVALREGVDTLDFSSDAFAPFLPQAVTQLMDLIGTANTFDSKRKVDDALNVVIDRVGSQIIPLVPLIAGPIPALWIEADDDFLFKSSLLVTMTNLVKAIGPESTALSQIVVPLVQQSMEQGSELDQDGITLWKEALRNTNAIDTPNHSLANLLPLLIKQLDNNFDLLGSLLNITESYFLLEPARMLQVYAITLLGVFLTIVKSQTVLQSNKKDALSALNLLVQMTPPVLWAEAMHQSGLFPYLLDIYIIDKVDTQLLCELENLFSRIALADCGILLELVRLATPGLEAGREPDKIHVPLTGEKVLDLFLDRWWGTFDYMSHPRYRKLVAMGTAALVATAQPQILSRLHSEFFNLWMDVFCEIKEAQNPVTTDDDGQEVPSYLTLYWEQQDAPASYYQDSEGTPEYNRRKAVFDSDPVRATQLSIYVGIQLREAERIYLSTSPQTSFQQQYLALADPTVLQQITAAMNG
ncbi:ran binding protein 11 [Rhodocollybia butyracea]|uniref:Ran binding protein 11 n=1 Tax=Rhodocollybia butyracea TaxID=206335 RepID=A0A9P5Q9L6_9AGAR|nr:ran binding protein 11 [Rhodocollybia butyracea]